MAYTAEDLANIESAIATIGTGKSVAKVSIAGKTVEYREANIDMLLNLRAMIQRELGLVPSTVYTKNMGRTRT
jgi:hypothetical protein